MHVKEISRRAYSLNAIQYKKLICVVPFKHNFNREISSAYVSALGNRGVNRVKIKAACLLK